MGIKAIFKLSGFLLTLVAGTGFVSVAGIVGAQAQEVVPLNQMEWGTYLNEAYGVYVEVPRTGFIEQPSSNEAGDTLLSQSGYTIITMFGSDWTNTAPQFSDYKTYWQNQFESQGAEITYAPSGNKWFVFSGYLGDNIFYLKASTRTNCSVAGHLYFSFPKSERESVSPLIEYMEDSFRLEPSQNCPAG